MTSAGRPGPVVLGIDLGTTGVKVLAFDPAAGAVVASAAQEHQSSHTADGGHEQDPRGWWDSTVSCCRAVTRRLDERRIAAVGLAGQMHSLLLLDSSRVPVRAAMTWADRRVRAQTERLARYPAFEERAGNRPVDAFTAPKLAWLAETDPERLASARHLVLAKDYLGLLLTGDLATDTTDAMGTLLWDHAAGEWDRELFALCGSTESLGVPVLPSTATRGAVTVEAAEVTGIPAGTPVVAGAGDVSAAVLGAGVVDASTMCLNVGTAAQVMGVSSTADPGPGFLFGEALGRGGYVCMASVYAAGASVRWAEQNLFGGRPISEVADAAAPGADGLSYLPYMSGSVIPRKNDAARGGFLGQAPSHGSAALAAAVLEGVAFACADAVDAVAAVTGTPTRVHIVGGVTASRRFREAFAAALDIDVIRIPDAGSALGAAILAALGAGMLSESDPLAGHASEPVSLEPESRRAYREARELFAARRDLVL